MAVHEFGSPSKIQTEEVINRSNQYNREDSKQQIVRSSEPQNNYRKSISQGLPNLGNTCFMNSILQCIAHFSSFEQFFKSTPLKSNYSRSLQDLILCMRSPSNAATLTATFTNESVRLNKHGNGSQQDSKEFYCSILEALLSDSPSIKETCILQKKETYTFEGCICTNQVTTDYPFIPLSVSSRNNWKTELQEFLREQRTVDYYYCIRCRVKRKGCIETAFKFPKVLGIYFHQPINVELGCSVVIDNANTAAKKLGSRNGGRGVSCHSEISRKNENGKSIGQRVEYKAEACVLRSGSTAQCEHYWAMTFEDEQIFGYDDTVVTANRQRNVSAYMLFLAINK